MSKDLDFSVLEHMLIDSKEYWEEEGFVPPTPKERHKMHMDVKERQVCNE